MTRIICLLGSPRKGGNSDVLAQHFVAAARENGAQIEIHALRDLQFQGCINLMDCKTGGETCGQNDDMLPVLASIQAADVVVLASPIYFCNISGLAKQAVDRFFSFFVPDYVTATEPSRLGRKKSFVLIQTQGEGVDRYGDLLGQYGPALDKMGFARRTLIRSCGVRNPGDVNQDAMALEHAVAIARELCATSATA